LLNRIAGALETANAKEDPPEKEQREESDLRAQWKMAEWAFWMMVASFAQVVIGGAGIWYIRRTLVLNRIATLAAAEAAQAADRAVEVASKTAERQLRAYVSVNHGAVYEQKPPSQLVIEIQPFMENHGQTPAYNLTYASEACLVPSFPIPADFDFQIPALPYQSMTCLNPGQKLAMFCGMRAPLSAEALREIKGPGPRRLCIYGRVSYTDAFGEPRYTNFSFVIGWNAEGQCFWVNTQQHNDSN